MSRARFRRARQKGRGGRLIEPSEARIASPVQGPSINFLLIALIFTALGVAIGTGSAAGSGAAFVFVMAGWVLSLCLHEFGHAFVAWRGGDTDIPATGYLTLDPRLYADPLSSIVLPLVFTILGGIGFPGGSVFVNRERLRGRVWQSAMSAAGPATNVLCLLFLMLLYRLSGEDSDALRAVIAVSALFQGTAIVLNLLPIPGLDGYGILRPWLPEAVVASGDRLALYSGLVLTGLFLFSSAFGRTLLRASLYLTTLLGFASADVGAGYNLIRLW